MLCLGVRDLFSWNNVVASLFSLACFVPNNVVINLARLLCPKRMW